MKAIIFILALFLLGHAANAQTFGREGTIWQHCFFTVLELPPPYELLTMSSGTSFKINNLDCNTLSINPAGYLRVHDTINICRDADRVFYQGGDSLFLLYDFSLKKGDTLRVRFPIEFDTSFLENFPQDNIHYRLVIDSVTIERLAGQDLIKQHFTNLDDHTLITFGRYMMERFGFEYWVLPYFGFAAIDGDGFAGLHSYQDQEITVDLETPCQSTGVYDEGPSKQGMTIYPNPADEKMTIQSEGRRIVGLDIYSSLGIHEYSIKNVFDDKVEVVTSKLLPGPHFVRVRFKDRVEGQLIYVD